MALECTDRDTDSISLDSDIARCNATAVRLELGKPLMATIMREADRAGMPMGDYLIAKIKAPWLKPSATEFSPPIPVRSVSPVPHAPFTLDQGRRLLAIAWPGMPRQRIVYVAPLGEDSDKAVLDAAAHVITEEWAGRIGGEYAPLVAQREINTLRVADVAVAQIRYATAVDKYLRSCA